MSTTEIYVRGLILIGLLLLSALFSGSETAITSITVSQIRKFKEEDEEAANILKEMKKSIGDILATILIGNNLVNIAATSLLTEMSIRLTSGNQNATLITTAVMTVLILIIGEITPKTYATQNSIKVAKAVSRPLTFLSFIIKPVLFILQKITNVAVRMLGGEVDSFASFVTEEDIRSLVDAGEEEGVLKYQEKEMIQNIFDIDDLEVAEVMVPRIDVVAVSRDTGIKEILEVAIEHGYSRIPVYEETIDNIIGVLYAKDLLPLVLEDIEDGKDIEVVSLMRKTLFVPETKKVNHLLKELQQSKIHMAIVLDEYGGTEGLVTIEDILEEIVGDIFDEYDNEIDLVEKIGKDKYKVQGEISLEEVNEIFENDLPEEDFDSMGGYVFSTLGRVPAAGDIVNYKDLEIKVLGVQNRRVTEMEIVKLEQEVLEDEENEKN